MFSINPLTLSFRTSSANIDLVRSQNRPIGSPSHESTIISQLPSEYLLSTARPSLLKVCMSVQVKKIQYGRSPCPQQDSSVSHSGSRFKVLHNPTQSLSISSGSLMVSFNSFNFIFLVCVIFVGFPNRFRKSLYCIYRKLSGNI